MDNEAHRSVAQRSPDSAQAGAADVSQIEQAIYQLYQDPDPNNKVQADRWLQSFQQTPQAWNIAWILLQQQSVEVQNFGALTLCSKISRSWAELPREQYSPLQQELFKAITKFSTGPKVVLIQLCRALVGVAFNTMPELWPNTVVSCIQSMRSASQSTADADFSTAVLQFLTILPEEFESTSMSVAASRRGVIRRELCSGLQSVLSLLEEVLSTARQTPTKIEAMKCCCSWVQFGLPLPEISSLIDLLFHCLSVPDLIEKASETLQEMLSHDDSFKYPTALRKFLQRVLQVKDFIRTKVEENDSDTCVSLAHLVQDTANANLDILMGVREESVEEVGECLEIVQLMLEFTCVSGCYPVDEQCSEVSLSFWSNFLDHIANSEPDRSRFLADFYNSTITSLIEVLPDKAQYPPDKDWEEDWIDDDRDSFTKYREDLCDVGECLQRIMHMEYLQHLSSLLSSLLAPSQTPSWQSIEAALYLLQGVASHVHQQSSPHLQNILALLPRMPVHPVLVKTALALFGCLSSWFKGHVNLLQAVLPMILDALGQPSLAPSAALAFRDVCGDCASELAPVVVQIIPVCQTSLSNPELDSRDCVRLISAVGSVLSSMPLKDLIPPLESLVQSRVQSLQTLAMADTTEGSKGQVEKELIILASLCHHIYPTLQSGEQHPVVMLLVQLFPSLQTLVSKWCTDQDIVESICVCFNRGMRSVHEQYAPLLEGTVEIVVKCYAAVHHAKLLDSAAQIVEIFGKESSCSQLILTLVTQLHSTSVQIFQSSIGEHPDTVQAYLGLMTVVIQKCPLLFLNSEETANNLFEIGLAALQLPEQPTVTAASAFFVSYISLFPSLKPIQEIMTLNGRTLLQYIIQAIAWSAPRSYLKSFTDIICALNSHCITLLSQWLEDLLSQDGYPSSHLTVVEKQQFKTTLLREHSNKRILREKVKEFSLMCRGFHGTLYAAETS